MAHDAFISYSSNDKTVALAVCSTLENQGIRCWIAPRDIPPGKSWPASIVEAIRNSKVFVLVFSNGSNQSKQVFSEVGEAFDKEIPIVPFRIENVEPSQEMGYFIKTTHWLDAMNPPLERDLTNLANSVESFLAAGDVERPPVSETVTSEIVRKRKRLPTWSKIVIGLMPMVILIIAIIWLQIDNSSNRPPRVILPEDADTERYIENGVTTDLPSISETSITPGRDDWQTLSFNIPDETLWSQSGENAYTIIANPQSDTIAWSDEIITGDLILTAEVTHESRLGAAMFIIYGDGIGFSNGSLIAHYGSTTDGNGWTAFEAHSIYADGNLLVSNDGDFYLSDEATTIMIEISDGKANLYADGQNVASVFLPPEINHTGRIGILQHWEQPVGATYSNIKIKTSSAESLDAEPDGLPITGSTPSQLETINAEWSDWRPISFMIPNPQLWNESGGDRYIAVEQKDVDAFAWSTENFEGDISLSLDLKSAVKALDLSRSEMISQIPNQNSGCVIIYGDGHEHSHGSLIFCVDWDGYYLHKHTIYHQDEPLAFIPNANDSDKVYSVRIEILDDMATMFIEGENVFSTFFDTEEIDRNGKIGLFRNWAKGEITFTNVQIKTRRDVD